MKLHMSGLYNILKYFEYLLSIGTLLFINKLCTDNNFK